MSNKKKEKQAKQINLATKIQKNEKSTNHLHNYALCIVHYALPKHLQIRHTRRD